jgi:hypothetical protein
MARYSMLKDVKRAVGYERPAKGPDHCGICRNFRPPQSCRVVYGDIHPEDWCKRFVKLEEDG